MGSDLGHIPWAVSEGESLLLRSERIIKLETDRPLQIRLTGYSLYWTQMCAVKLSILLLYSRIFTVAYRFRVMTWITAAIVVAYSVAGLVGTLALCKPAVGTCGNITTMAVVSSALNILTDVLIFCLPLQQVYRLQVTTRQRIGLALIFATGFL